jgi:hypothetical protein
MLDGHSNLGRRRGGLRGRGGWLARCSWVCRSAAWVSSAVWDTYAALHQRQLNGTGVLEPRTVGVDERELQSETLLERLLLLESRVRDTHAETALMSDYGLIGVEGLVSCNGGGGRGE